MLSSICRSSFSRRIAVDISSSSTDYGMLTTFGVLPETGPVPILSPRLLPVVSPLSEVVNKHKQNQAICLLLVSKADNTSNRRMALLEGEYFVVSLFVHVFYRTHVVAEEEHSPQPEGSARAVDSHSPGLGSARLATVTVHTDWSGLHLNMIPFPRRIIKTLPLRVQPSMSWGVSCWGSWRPPAPR